MSQIENIKVYIRVKPNEDKRSIIDYISDRELGVKEKCGKKSLSFARVFSPSSDQVSVYKTVAHPLVIDALSGYNCTLFAYGQSGSGKTYTMLGEKSPGRNLSWENETFAGLIPRSITQIFDEADAMENEVIFHISSILICNEDLYDLLSYNEEIKLRLYDDSKKGGVRVSGLEEVPVRNKEEAFKCMEQVFSKKETLTSSLNIGSSSYHTLFTINMLIKDTSVPNEELFVSGKLCMVDLGGSDSRPGPVSGANSRPGMADKSGWDTSKVNLSLLTLGRVINSLHMHSSHIPYRESKLTRLLRDSLGGSSKACIIATIKPFLKDIDETVNTLDCMNKAKMIVNRPQVNKRETQGNIIMKYKDQLVRLRRDLEANKIRNGIFMDEDNFNEMGSKIEALETTVLDLEKKLKYSEEKAKEIEVEKHGLSNKLDEKDKELDDLTRTVVQPYNEAKKQLETYKSLLKQTVSQSDKIMGKICESRKFQKENNFITKNFRRKQAAHVSALAKRVRNSIARRNANEAALTEFATSHAEKSSNERAVALDCMLGCASETSKNLLQPCQERLDKTGNDIRLCSEKIAHCQSAILEQLGEDGNKNVVDTNELEKIFDKIYLNVNKLNDDVKSSLGDVTNSMDNSRATLKKQVHMMKAEHSQMIQYALMKDLERLTALREANTAKLEELRIQLQEKDRIIDSQQELLTDQKMQVLIDNVGLNKISDIETRMQTHVASLASFIDKHEDDKDMLCEFQEGLSEASIAVAKELENRFKNQDKKLESVMKIMNKLQLHDSSPGFNNVKEEVEKAATDLSLKAKQKADELKIQARGIEAENANFRRTVEDSFNNKKENSQQSLNEIKLHASVIAERNATLQSNLSDQLRLHNSLFDEELREYQPTGETPQRQGYRLPQQLQDVSPFRRLKQRDLSNIQDTVESEEGSE